ncbi:hypothetical protein [Acidicapsa ligni]|uniref:hypothetical protein n=1 Tax=Acidicapsa ligni TaxID=542300 RepID=UPI0021DF7E1A|nr:hypothetical protein [Acidicapsa ligni]
MQQFLRIIAIVMLITGVACAQTSSGSQPAASQSRQKAEKVKPKTQEQILLEQLNDKFHKLDDLNRKYDDLQQRFDVMQKDMKAQGARLERAEKDAADARQKLDANQPMLTSNDAAVTHLQTEVADLKTTSSSLSAAVETTQQTTKSLEHPEGIRFKGVEIIPGGFAAAETVNRQRAVSGDVNTPFSSIPFTGTTAGKLSEFNASGRQSRVSLLAEGHIPNATLRGYWEADFLAAGTTSNDNQSNSYTLRQRQVWGQAALNSGWTLTGGQMWSLATEYNHGLANRSEATPLTIDAQYNVGFTWARQYGFRVVKQTGKRLALGVAVEESQILNIGGHNLPTLTFQQTGTGGGLYNSTANYSFNYAPDLVGKIAYDRDWGHFEVFGVGRFFRDRVFPNGPTPPGATPPATTSALGAFTARTEGGGVGVNGRIHLLNDTLSIGAHGLLGNGVGRYSTTTLPDATAHADGTLELLTGGSALGTVEWHATPRFDLYAYYGGEDVKRAYYATGFTNTTPGPAQGQPILAGYGAPTNIVSGCYTEVLPTTSPNGGGTVASGPANCNADTRNIQEGTLGYWFRLYRGTHGTVQQGIQYSYVAKHTWQGIGDPEAGAPNSPKAIDNMWFTSFRYYIP